MVTVSLYARVSSGRQAQEDTIASQIAAIENQISMDGHKLLNEYKFIDNGYSGSNIIRPGLEKLRDKIAEGNIDKVYIHSPDRLSRKYAYQMILLEEFKKLGVEVIFLNYQISDNPESQLLLQMQGMIAEYERAKIMERSRRGKIYAANKGCISVMSAAPYGYRYINKNTETGQALFEIYEEEAEVVRKVFSWVGRERASIGEVCRRLSAMSIMTRTGKEYWDRAVVLSMLKNTAYKGQAAFGKTRFGVKLKHIRPKKNSCEHPKDNYSTYPVPKEDWIYIKVPSIVSEDLFEIVQEQLAENRKIARTRQRGAKHLLQGLVVCKLCNYAYYGTSTARNKEGKKTNNQVYYRCIGTDSYRFGGNKMCNNKLIRTDTLDMAVWEEVKHLLKNPNRILEEYKRRLSELKKSPLDQKSALLETQEDKLKRGIARLIDSYAQEYIDQEEFEPRIKAMKQNLKMVEEQKKKIFDQKKLTQELTLVVTNLEGFSSSINSSLNNADWLTKRDIIRTLVKRIEINFEDVNIVFRVKELPDSFHMEKNQCLQCCCRGRYDGSWRHDVEPTLTIETKRRIIMSTIVLSSIFGQAGSIFGPIGQIIGSELGALLGAQLDGAMFSLDAEQKVTHGARLKNLQVQTSTYGRTIPIIYGTARIAGNIIWSQPIKEEAITTKSKIGRGMNVEYNYYATLAIAICKGKVEKLNRIWADTTSLSFDEIDYTFYRGTEDQNPDPFMSSIEGVPAYRGISYIVIKNFPLADYNNRVPVFTFEVQTILKPSGFSVVENIQNINIIPGSGEFVYDTKIQKKIAQEKISSNQYIPYGLAQRVNHNNHTKKSDAVLSLDQLKGDLPNVEWVSVVVNWFVNDL